MKPDFSVVESVRNFTQRKFEEDLSAEGAVFPQYRPISGEKGPLPSLTCSHQLWLGKKGEIICHNHI